MVLETQNPDDTPLSGELNSFNKNKYPKIRLLSWIINGLQYPNDNAPMLENKI